MSLVGYVRKYERVAFSSRVELAAGAGSPAVEAYSLDISLGGVGLISPALLKVGHAVTLGFRLSHPSKGPVLERVQGRVVFARSDVDGHRLGVEFLEPLHRSKNPELTRKVEGL